MLIGHGQKAWRIVRVEDLIPGDWSERAVQMWHDERMPDPWQRAPFRVIVTPVKGGDEHMMTVEPWHFITWHVLPEHYAICAECGEPAPCIGHLSAVEAAREIERASEAMELPDGFCPACREPITHRQKVFRFAGENLLNPLGSPMVRFHQRTKCRGAAAAYEEKWVAADASRERSLLTLRCEGFVTVHADGSGECHGRNDGIDCPNIYARHRMATSCAYLSHGCPKCPPGSRHGCRLASGLNTDGSPS
ncbi:hypothetical protein VV02_07705 [Luteipulveratus mongoliensis]|uniref:Uncharacterized protein n=1 Tax=Luteipulveratus mongoliensis TaxID=571913 RepID=A0A0K1JGQ5_9MICO|nr:hypothetical protein VV02_07705 [Luteipulveratus mongoliensis]